MNKILIIIPSNGSKHHWYPLGAMQVAKALSRRGHTVHVHLSDVLGQSPEQTVDSIDGTSYDYVGIGWIAGRYPHHYCTTLTRLLQERGHRVVIGGHAPSSDPEWYLDHTGATAVIVGEADGITDWDGITGVVPGKPGDFWYPYSDDITSSVVLSSYYHMVPSPGASSTDRVFPVISGFGCPYKCSFCFRLAKGRRNREVDEIKEEILCLIKNYNATFIQFQDELLMTSIKRTEQICEMIQPLGVKWSCQGRVNIVAKDHSILKKMKEAGCTFINFGIESLSNKVLEMMGKKQNTADSRSAVYEARKAGISPGINMLWGCPGDDYISLRSATDFILAYTDHSQRRTIRPVTPYPGTPLYQSAIKDGLIKDTGDFYDKLKNSDLITVNFMAGISTEEAHKELYEANLRLLKEYERASINTIRKQATNLYLKNKGKEFRGWRQI